MDSDNILELKTVQTSNIKVLTEVLKEVLLGDINIIFTHDSIKIIELDGSREALVYLKLRAESFEYYNCTETIYAGINTLNLYKIVKTASNNDVISIYINKNDQSRLSIKIYNEDTGHSFNSNLILLDVPINVKTIKHQDYPSIITLQSSKFQKYMKDLNSLCTDCIIDIRATDQKVIFKTVSDFSENTITMVDKNNKKHNNTDIIQGMFLLKFLLLFTKATHLCHEVGIYLDNDKPIILEYAVGNLGELRFVLNQSRRHIS